MGSFKRSKKRSTGRAQKPRATDKKKRVWLWWFGGVLLIVAVLILVFTKGELSRNGSGKRNAVTLTERPNYQSLVGDWLRPDGGYVIRITGVNPDGIVDAGYFNPRPVNVSRAVASFEGEKTKLFIELRDRGYPGSTYNLTYNAKEDALVGIYYQAAIGQSFEVAFFRK